MAKDTQLRTEILITCNAQNADTEIKNIKKSVKALDTQISTLSKEYEKLQKSGQGDSKRAKQIQSEIKWLTKLRSSLNSFERESVKGAERVEKAVNNLAGTSTRELRRARLAAQRFRDSLSAKDPQFAKANDNLRKIQQQIDKNTGAVNKHGSAWKTTIKNMVAYVGVFGALNMVKSKIEEIISMNNKLSDQMANIRKVSNLPMGDIKALTRDLYKSDTRTAPTEMLDIAYAGAKLGMGNGGIDQLSAFTRAANVVNVALKEDMGQDALTALSKIVENMGLIKSMGVEQAMNKVGSAMFRLSSTSTATSSNIVEFAKRLTAMARVAGITTDQLLALGSASDSMYLAPEVAATAFTKLFSSLQTNHNLIEKTLKIEPGTINSLFTAGKAMDAVVLIFQKMHDLGNMNALKPIFKDLGSDGARLMNVMTAMAKNVDMLKEHLHTSNEAYKEGTAVLDEYNIQQQTSAALVERANNLWQKTFVNGDNVDVVHELAQAWYDLSKSFTSSQLAIGTIKWALQGLITLMKAILFILPSVIMGFGAQGLVLSVTKLLGVLGGLHMFIGRLIVAFKALSFAAKANWIVAVASGIAFLTAKILESATAADKATGFMQGFTRSLTGAGNAVADSVAELESYKRAISSAAVGTERRNVAIQNFNKKFGQYLSHLLTEKSTAKQLALAYEEVNTALQKKAYLELRDKDMKQQIVPRAGHERNLGMEYDAAIRGTSSAGMNTAWLRAFWAENRGKGNQQMFDLLNTYMFNTPLNDATVRKIQYLDHTNGTSDAIPEQLKKLPKAGKSGGENAQVRYFLALRYLHAYGALQNATRQVDDKYKGLNLDTEPTQEDLGGLNNKATDKDAITAAKAAERARNKEHRERVKAANEMFKNAKEQATAVISAIDEYYNLQESAVTDAYNAGKLQKENFNQLNTFLEKRRNEMLMNARLWMSGRKNDFVRMRKEEFGWGKDRYDLTDKSNASYNKVMKFNGDATYKVISRFDGKDGMPDGNSFMDSVSKNASANELKIKDAETKIHDAVVDYLNKNDVANTVADKFAEQLRGLGIAYADPVKQFQARETQRDDATLTTDGTSLPGVVATAQAKKPESMQRKILGAFIQNGTNNYGFDPSDGKKLQEWLLQFSGFKPNYDGSQEIDQRISFFKEGSFASQMPDMSDWVFNFEKNKDKVLVFYKSLVEAEDNYYNSVKANTDREKRILNERWERSDRGKAYDSLSEDWQTASKVENIYGRGESGAFLNTQEMARNNGFADNITNNPDVVQAEISMRTMQEKLEMARQTQTDMQAIRDAEKAANDAELAYAEKINEQIKARMDLLQQWVDPIKEFSEQVGDAFVKMGEDAGEGQQAIKDATQNMLKTFAKMTIDMIAQQLKMETQRALFHDRMKKGEKEYQEGLQGENEKGHKSIFKSLASFFKRKKKDTQKANKDEKKEHQSAEKEKTDITETSEKTQEKVKTEVSSKILSIEKKADTESSQAKTEAATADAATTGAETQGNIFAGIASGAAKIIGKLGWWGIPLIAVIQGLLMGLLNSALSKLFGGKGGSASTTNTKLVSGMLTYDSGNVEAFRGAIDQKTYPVVGNDGKVYAAKPTDSLVTGLLTEPVATTVGGVPSLIAERGPEMIIGRETTQALMMARPDIISEIVRFDKNHSGRTYKAYDGGNVADVVGNAGGAAVSAYSDPQTQAGMANIVATMQAMMPAMQAFVRQLQQPINAKIGMYGKDGIYENVRKASKFMAGK